MKHHVALLKPTSPEEPLRPITNPSSTQKSFFEGTRPRPEHSPQKGMIQENFWVRGQRARMELASRSESRAEPERSPSGARTEHGIPKGRSGFRNYNIYS